MMNFLAGLDLENYLWIDFKNILYTIDISSFPDPYQLQNCLPTDISNIRGKPITLTPAANLPGVDYEAHIHATGQVSTRAGSLHDLCNALVWARLPHIKAVMNDLHVSVMEEPNHQGRGPQRDALTLFDESGAVILSQSSQLLAALARRDWVEAFQTLAAHWQDTVVVVTGHANLEKALRPYKAITAQCLLIQTPLALINSKREALLQATDRDLAAAMAAGKLLRDTRDLCPVPVMGIPEWWPAGNQDTQFYSDTRVFRPASPDQQPGPVFIYPEQPAS